MTSALGRLDESDYKTSLAYITRPCLENSSFMDRRGDSEVKNTC